ncbi:MAG TPA: hypothetical protein VLC09_10595 [Polyangiaceae bacterium]|nr:hypothetical protein [Polyangiaceae bacterium]
MKTSHIAAPLAALAIVSLAAPTEARADFMIGLDINYLGTVSTDSDTVQTSPGAFGWGPRIGYEIPVAFLYLRPEAGLTFAHFDTHSDTRLYGGARLGFDSLISPAVYAHIGEGWYNVASPSYNDFTWDFGGALDVRLPVVAVGVHVGMDQNPQVSPSWVNVGAHAELRF